jgi:Skp family chaperone for outer membrane proteins
MKIFLALILLPLLSCGNTNSKPGNPSAAYQTTDEVAQSINHATWDALLKKMFSKRKCKLQGLSKDSKQLQAYLNELSANVPTKSWSKNATLLLDQCIQCLYSKINFRQLSY